MINKAKKNELIAEMVSLGEDILGTDVEHSELEKIKKSNLSILNTYPANFMAGQILDKTIRHKKTLGVIWYKAITVTALILCIFPLAYYYVRYDTKIIKEEGDIIKGLEPHLLIYLKDGDTIKRLHDKSIVKPGDLIQISYVRAAYKYVMIFSKDGEGNITFHLAKNGDQAFMSDIKGRVVLDSSFRLDDAPFFEDFYYAYSNSVFSFKDVQRVLNGKTINTGIIISKIRLKKEE